jgi:hypothetical protein
MASLKNSTVNDTGFIQMPIGTTSQRPASPSIGDSRYNNTLVTLETYNGSGWSYFPNIALGSCMRLDAAEPASYSGSGTAWNDISGFGNNGTLVNSPTFSSTYGGGFTFNKSTTYVSLPTNLLTDNDFSIVMWIKGDGTSGGQTLFGNYPSGPLQTFYSTAYIGMWLDNSTAYADAALYYTSNVVQFTATRSGTTTSIYLNTSLIKQGSSSSSLGTNKTFRIGTNTAGTEQFGGTIYTCQLYRRALTVTEIAKNYMALRYRFGV